MRYSFAHTMPITRYKRITLRSKCYLLEFLEFNIDCIFLYRKQDISSHGFRFLCGITNANHHRLSCWHFLQNQTGKQNVHGSIPQQTEQQSRNRIHSSK